MSISKIDTKTKFSVLKYLLEQNETFEDACSKSALTTHIAKKLLASN